MSTGHGGNAPPVRGGLGQQTSPVTVGTLVIVPASIAILSWASTSSPRAAGMLRVSSTVPTGHRQALRRNFHRRAWGSGGGVATE